MSDNPSLPFTPPFPNPVRRAQRQRADRRGLKRSYGDKPSRLAHVLAGKLPQVSVTLVFELVLNADFRSVVRVRDARFELDEEFLFRFLRILLALRDAFEQGDALLLGGLHERPPAHLV